MWMLLIPFAAFAVAFLVGALALWFLSKKTKISETETTSGKTFHVESPIGSLDVHPEAKLDPRLANIALYPGAMPENALAAESVSELRIGWKTARDISATYWTPDSVNQVWDFYRRQLPEWPRNLVEAQGKELIHRDPDCVVLIRVTGRKDRTIIETCIKPAEYPYVFGDGC